jgi:hypothetical protein
MYPAPWKIPLDALEGNPVGRGLRSSSITESRNSGSSRSAAIPWIDKVASWTRRYHGLRQGRRREVRDQAQDVRDAAQDTDRGIGARIGSRRSSTQVTGRPAPSSRRSTCRSAMRPPLGRRRPHGAVAALPFTSDRPGSDSVTTVVAGIVPSILRSGVSTHEPGRIRSLTTPARLVHYVRPHSFSSCAAPVPVFSCSLPLGVAGTLSCKAKRCYRSGGRVTRTAVAVAIPAQQQAYRTLAQRMGSGRVSRRRCAGAAVRGMSWALATEFASN